MNANHSPCDHDHAGDRHDDIADTGDPVFLQHKTNGERTGNSEHGHSGSYDLQCEGTSPPHDEEQVCAEKAQRPDAR
ncbi:hypothetical protein [Brevibacterium antiquum]|uniref:hypothetical protein n=1 Tax=Brevibacterium antiquum TaxID=234835 RepID=UPI000C78AA7D|nr:hypothetical protein [Brevibacterium antiquum]